MYLLDIGLNHKTAPVEIRERMAFSGRELSQALKELRREPYIEGCVILSTCNRTEVCVATRDMDAGLGEVKEFISRNCKLPLNEVNNYLYVHTLYDAVHHLFRVASGLDSMIIGETQILGQVKDAYQAACEAGVTNGVINTLFQQAITVGKRVRQDTKIDQNAVSISYAAVELAKNDFGGLQGKTVLIVGAGKMSQLAVRYLVANGVSTVLVSNRSYDRACALADEVGGRAYRFDSLKEVMETADIVISCTAASHCIIHKDDVQGVMARRRARKLVMIDIAVPRDIEAGVSSVDGVTLYDIDDLQGVIKHNLDERQQIASRAEAIIEEEVDAFFKWISSLFVVPTIVALKQKGELIKETELNRAINRLAPLSEREKKVISSLANSIVNQLLHDPIINLKEYAATQEGHLYTEILQNLFNLEVEGEEIPGMFPRVQEERRKKEKKTDAGSCAWHTG